MVRYARVLWRITQRIDRLSRDATNGLYSHHRVVSNHGNWFTSDDPNKELQVLAQSYDWLLFLTDAGLSQFIEEMLLSPTPPLELARTAFLESYSGKRGANRFTKVRIGLDADTALWNYFASDDSRVNSWFNVIAPGGGLIDGTTLRPSETGQQTSKERVIRVTAGRNNSVSVSNHWGTPPKYVDAVQRFFGRSIALDPCSSEHSIVGAEVEFKLPETDGLAALWNYETVFVNPPYGADRERRTTIRDWLHKCADARTTYGAEVLALVPVATNTKHWKLYVWAAATGVTFLYDTRLRFPHQRARER